MCECVYVNEHVDVLKLMLMLILVSTSQQAIHSDAATNRPYVELRIQRSIRLKIVAGKKTGRNWPSDDLFTVTLYGIQTIETHAYINAQRVNDQNISITFVWWDAHLWRLRTFVHGIFLKNRLIALHTEEISVQNTITIFLVFENNDSFVYNDFGIKFGYF